MPFPPLVRPWIELYSREIERGINHSTQSQNEHNHISEIPCAQVGIISGNMSHCQKLSGLEIMHATYSLNCLVLKLFSSSLRDIQFREFNSYVGITIAITHVLTYGQLVSVSSKQSLCARCNVESRRDKRSDISVAPFMPFIQFCLINYSTLGGK